MTEKIILETALVLGFLGYFLVLFMGLRFWRWIRRSLSGNGIGMIMTRTVIGVSFLVCVLFFISGIRLMLNLDAMGPIVKWTLVIGFVVMPWWTIYQIIRWMRSGRGE